MVTEAEKQLIEVRLDAERRRLTQVYDEHIAADIRTQVMAQLRDAYNLRMAEQADAEIAKYRSTPVAKKQRAEHLAKIEANIRATRAQVLEDLRLQYLAREQRSTDQRGATASKGNALLTDAG